MSSRPIQSALLSKIKSACQEKWQPWKCREFHGNPNLDIVHINGIRSAASYVQVVNESYMHNVPDGSETHFKVVVVSPQFEGMSRIQRHRLINGAVANELAGNVHALAIEAKTVNQQQTKQSQSQQNSHSKISRGYAMVFDASDEQLNNVTTDAKTCCHPVTESPSCRGGFGL